MPRKRASISGRLDTRASHIDDPSLIRVPGARGQKGFPPGTPPPPHPSTTPKLTIFL
ncbi:hypothetical protein DPMN_082224 [Dreissena polymorpha]|uniref:Uncharacterized protein n=1 Tax=Dreissena polymorpha TaxID=45954 RepID=A0A9D3Y6I2_DREPO|nr:hypothetical protein DPMN_082224 [Dreissena polymorpha]